MKAKIVVYSVLISLIVHLSFFVCSTNIKIKGVLAGLDRAKRLFNIKALEKIEPERPIKERGIYTAQKLKFERPTSIESTPYRIDMEETELPADFSDKMPGFTPEITGGILDLIKEKVIPGFTKGGTAIKRTTEFTGLNEYLVVELFKYEAPEDGQKYYKLSIKPGKQIESLPTIPKEIIFLIDCSLSIRENRIEQFKKGIGHYLKGLNAEDYFNIIVFKESVIRFSPHSVKLTKANIQNAIYFVETFTSGDRTNMYDALYDAIKADSSIIPSYIVFFSDGYPTDGETDSRKIINEISKLNNNKKAIFTFSGGSKVNRYLLDFISYKNRGWPEYAQRTHLIGKCITRMYEKIKEPVLLNLRYRLSGVDEGEIFPKVLPDFYRNTEFSLYGSYINETEFSLQLLGDSDNETNEFMVIGSFKDAATGDRDIARNWAFNKIYYLISSLESGKKDEQIIKEINFLCHKFDIDIPYDIEK